MEVSTILKPLTNKVMLALAAELISSNALTLTVSQPRVDNDLKCIFHSVGVEPPISIPEFAAIVNSAQSAINAELELAGSVSRCSTDYRAEVEETKTAGELQIFIS